MARERLKPDTPEFGGRNRDVLFPPRHHVEQFLGQLLLLPLFLPLFTLFFFFFFFLPRFPGDDHRPLPGWEDRVVGSGFVLAVDLVISFHVLTIWSSHVGLLKEKFGISLCHGVFRKRCPAATELPFPFISA